MLGSQVDMDRQRRGIYRPVMGVDETINNRVEDIGVYI